MRVGYLVEMSVLLQAKGGYDAEKDQRGQESRMNVKVNKEYEEKEKLDVGDPKAFLYILFVTAKCSIGGYFRRQQ